MKKMILPLRHVAVAAAALWMSVAGAQAYPSKPITLVVPFAPGASADGIARLIAKDLSGTLGQPVVVDNKPGGGGATGLLAMARTAADGYTIGLGAAGAIVVSPHLPDGSPLKPEKDLAPVAKLADIPLVFVAGRNAGIDSVASFVKKSKQQSDGISYGTTGQYTLQHLAGELLGTSMQARMVAVPYRGSGPAITDLLGGQIPVAMVDLTSAYPHVKSGALVALGVTNAQRSKVAPEIPTIAEAGVKNYSAPGWLGLFAPANTPQPVLKRLSEAVHTAMAKPEVQSQILALSSEPSYLDGAGFGQFIAKESAKWAEVIRAMPQPAK